MSIRRRLEQCIRKTGADPLTDIDIVGDRVLLNARYFPKVERVRTEAARRKK